MGGERMVYPYTLGAKIAQFPYKFYWNRSWLFKYSIIGYFVTLPIFYKIQKATYSPMNVQRYEQYLAKQKVEYAEHQKHLL